MANFKLRQTGEQIQKDLDKIENDALVKPGIAPSATSILAIDSTNTQTMLTVGQVEHYKYTENRNVFGIFLRHRKTKL